MPRLNPFQATYLLCRGVTAFAPAVITGLIVIGLGSTLMDGLLMLLSIVTVSLLLPKDNQLHPMTWGRHAQNIAAPTLGVALFFVMGKFSAHQIGLEPMIIAIFGAVVVRIGGTRLVRQIEQRRPLRIAVVGERDPTHELKSQLQENDVSKYQVIGNISTNGASNFATSNGNIPPLGQVKDLREIVKQNSVDLLVLSVESSRHADFDEVADSCLDLPVGMIGLNSLHEQLFGYVPIGRIDSAWFQYVMHPRFRLQLQPWGKRVFDLIFGVVISTIVLPLLAVLALAIRLFDGGPAFYSQQRIGEGGRRFRVVKLRTMYTDAEVEGHPKWSCPRDPRITKIGRLLRRTHLDELPQIINVLRGEMTFVGPRPERPAFVETLEKTVPYYSRRHLVRPGVTGWAQVRCGYVNSVLGSAWKMGHDLYYLKHRSPLFDLLILVETARTVFVGDHDQLSVPEKEIVLIDRAGVQNDDFDPLPGHDTQPVTPVGQWQTGKRGESVPAYR